MAKAKKAPRRARPEREQEVIVTVPWWLAIIGSRWTAWAVVALLGWLLWTTYGNLRVCRASLEGMKDNKPSAEASANQTGEMNGKAHIAVKYTPKPCPPAAVDGQGKCPPCECPTIDLTAFAENVAKSAQQQGAKATVHPLPDIRPDPGVIGFGAGAGVKGPLKGWPYLGLQAWYPTTRGVDLGLDGRAYYQPGWLLGTQESQDWAASVGLSARWFPTRR